MDSVEVQVLKERIHRFRRMAREMASRITVTEDAILDCMRAGGDALCKVCGLEYLEHPQIPGYPTFHLACTGKVMKL